MRVLEFKRPVFKKGLNYTVRLGTKWANVPIGKPVKIGKTGKAARIHYVVRCLLIMLLPMWQEILAKEHDPACRSFKGLVRELQRVYGRRKIGPRSEVTCLGFFVDEEAS